MPYLREFTPEFQAEISRQTENLVGSLIMTYKEVNSDSPVSFTAWVGKASIRPLINIHVRRFFLTLLNVDLASISKTNFQSFLIKHFIRFT